MDEIRARTMPYCVTSITETWLYENIQEHGLHNAIELAGLSLYRVDRTRDSGKSHGGGVCIFVNKWCTETAEKHCCPDLELLVGSFYQGNSQL